MEHIKTDACESVDDIVDLCRKLELENNKLRQALSSIENMSDSHSVMTKQEINLWVYDFLKELEKNDTY